MANPYYDSATDSLIYPNDPGDSVIEWKLSADAPDQVSALQDWQARIADPGVIWYHNFESDAEVNQFRWMGGYGNDPTGAGERAVPAAGGSQRTYRVATGGPGNSGYLHTEHAIGIDPNRNEFAQWWRPTCPLNGASNGRGVDDPCGSGVYNLRPDGTAITPQSFSPTPGGSQLNDYTITHPRSGYYTHSTYQNTANDGNESTGFYFQCRVQIDPRRTTVGMNTGGKNVWFNNTTASNANQEFVTIQAYVGPHDTFTGPGQANYHHMYGSNGSLIFGGGGTNGNAIQTGHDWNALECNPYEGIFGGCWAWPTDGSWPCLLYHVTPGTVGTANTRVEVWAATQSRITSGLGYQKIWDTLVSVPYETYTVGTGAVVYRGWNAILLSSYNNGYSGSSGRDTVTPFFQNYAQLIFSKNFIACPQV